MQFRIYDRQTLAYKDGGYVASYKIDGDYIANNNSTIKIVKALNNSVIEGDTIALIETSGVYHKGTITTFDNDNYSITYRGEKELFNDNMLNPYIKQYVDNEDLKIAGKFGISEVATILENYFGKSNDWAKVIPLKVITNGDVVDNDGKPKMLWNWSNASINVIDWLISLFERYNLSLNWTIDFNIANPISVEIENSKIKTKNGELDGEIIIHNNRSPYYVVTLSAVINSGKIIKDNVKNQIITYTERELPEATVCVIIDKESKDVVKMSNGINLLNPANIEKNKILAYNSGYGTTTKSESAGTDISGFIKVDVTKPYVLSFKKYDGNARNIIGFDKSQNPLWSVSYNFSSTTNRCITNLSFTGEQTQYIRINLCTYSEEIQFEQRTHTNPATASDYDAYNQPAIYYLINVAGRDMITSDINNAYRIFPVKTKIVEYDTNGEDTTEEQTAYENLVPSRFNQAIEIKIDKDSKMFDFENALYGDIYKIINQNGTIESNYTGMKEESGNKWVTLYFGLGRQNYTDLIQMRMRKSKYQVLYNWSK